MLPFFRTRPIVELHPNGGYPIRIPDSDFEDFYRFVRDRDPDDAAAMWATAGDGRSVFPTLTDQSFELFERYTADYVESRTDSTTPVEEV